MKLSIFATPGQPARAGWVKHYGKTATARSKVSQSHSWNAETVGKDVYERYLQLFKSRKFD